METQHVTVKLVESEKDWTDYVAGAGDILGPITTAILGILVLRATKRIEHAQWRNQKLIEKRIAVLDRLAPKLNEIYCYSVRVGRWKNISPKEVIEWKREVDKEVHTNRPYFSAEFFVAFMRFMNTCYKTYGGHGIDAKLRTSMKYHRDAHASWDSQWNACFSDQEVSEHEIKGAYHALQERLSLEFGSW